jgi:hypothetical protein
MAILVFVAMLFSVAPAAGQIHVAPAGNDANDGREGSPVRTLEKAQALARTSPGSTVILHGGTYTLGAPLVFTAADSGTTWRGADRETAVISGGKRITGWVKGEGGVWSAPVPDAETWYFRELFVNGRRAVRARFPNVTEKKYAVPVAGFDLSKDLKTEVLTVDPKYAKPCENQNDVEIVVFKNWASYHKRIQSVDAKKGRFTMMPPHANYRGSNSPRKGTYCFFENAREFLDEPGEWYLDRKLGRVFYKPRAGEDPDTAEIVAPALPQVVLLQGTPEAPVRNLTIENLTIAHHRYDLPPAGHHGRQACFTYGGDGKNGLPAMIQGDYVEGSSIVGCTIAHGGANGIELRARCRGNRIEGNHVHDLAGNGIGIGHHDREDTIPEKNRIANNYVHDCGTVFLGACGIWVGLARDIRVDHNVVCDLPYTGISAGWVWGPQPSLVRNISIEWNHIHDVMREVGDGGGIYTLGWQPGTVVRSNHIHGVHRGPFAHAAPNNGFFLDQGSKEYLVEDNLIYRTAGKPVRHNVNDPKGHTWKNNVFAQGDPPPGALPGVRAGAGLEGPWKRLLR